MHLSRFISALAVSLLALLPATTMASTSCSIDISVWTSSGQIKNPHSPVPLVSVDQFTTNGAYEYTIADQGSSFATVSGGSQCSITDVFSRVTSPLAAFGGQPSLLNPLKGVNVAFFDNRANRPFLEYPTSFEGSVVFTGTDSTTGEKFSATLPIMLVVTKRTD